MLLDSTFGGVWHDHLCARPAYRAMPPDRLAQAVALAEKVAAAGADLPALNARSLAWRAARRQPDRNLPR